MKPILSSLKKGYWLCRLEMQHWTTKQIKRVWWSMPGIMQWYLMNYTITLQPNAISDLKIKQMNASTICLISP